MNLALIAETKKEAEVCDGHAAVSLGHHMLKVKDGVTEILAILKPKAAVYMESLTQVQRDKILRDLYPDAEVPPPVPGMQEIPSSDPPATNKGVPDVPEISRPEVPEPRVYTEQERDQARAQFGIELP